MELTIFLPSSINYRLLIFNLIFCLSICKVNAQAELITLLQNESSSTSTAAKPQSKVWKRDGNWFCVFPKSSGSRIWKLVDDEWEEHLYLSSKSSSKADCLPVGDTTFIMLFHSTSPQFTTVVYNNSTQSYEFMNPNNSLIPVTLGSSAETCVIDIDGTGVLWMSYEANKDIYVRNSFPPYISWSTPYAVATGVKSDDISSIIQMDGKIGVFWSNQETELFGFKTHNDGDPINAWSNDEQPGAQSALNIGNGMADDHINMKYANNGLLYCAIKTSYDSSNHPAIGLLVRNPDGTWDDLYAVSTSGTRPICIIDEIDQSIKVLYTKPDVGGDIVYKQSYLNNLSFGNETILLDGNNYNNVSSTKRTNYCDVVVIARGSTNIVGAQITSQSCECISSNNNSALISSNSKKTYYGDSFTLKSPDGTCWSVSIDNAGNIRRTKTNCPL